MKINLKPKVRVAIYLFVLLGTPLVGYLFDLGIIGKLEVGLWGSYVTIAAGLAAFNVKGK